MLLPELSLQRQPQTVTIRICRLNLFNQKILELAKPSKEDSSARAKKLYLSQTDIYRSEYGETLFQDFLQRHSLADDDDKIVFIRSTIMNAFFTELVEDEGANHLFLEEISGVACQACIQLGL